MTTRFKSAAEAAAYLADNPEVKSQVENVISSNSLVSMLVSIRLSKGMSQTAIAQTMGCDPSKICKIESGNDARLRLSDVAGYLSALNVGMSMLFDDRSLPAAERIKHCVFKIHDDLESLAKLAQTVVDDKQIIDKIHQFYGEVLLNFLSRFRESYRKFSTTQPILREFTPRSLTSEAEKPTAVSPTESVKC